MDGIKVMGRGVPTLDGSRREPEARSIPCNSFRSSHFWGSPFLVSGHCLQVFLRAGSATSHRSTFRSMSSIDVDDRAPAHLAVHQAAGRGDDIFQTDLDRRLLQI